MQLNSVIIIIIKVFKIFLVRIYKFAHDESFNYKIGLISKNKK